MATRSRLGDLWPRVADAEGLRQRKKRQTRQLISDTATGLFLERGFDGVRIAEVAHACGVSEKTVYNYFPTKESLVLDRDEATLAAIERALGPAGRRLSPIEAAIEVIVAQVHEMFDGWAQGPEVPEDLTSVRRFIELVEQTPALRAARLASMERMVEVAAAAMAARAGVDPEAPEPQIAANAVLGLWRVQFLAIGRYADGTLPPAEVRDRVLAEVRRAARLIDTGLWSFGLAVRGETGLEQVRAAAQAAEEARRQVVTALRQARRAWRQVAAEVQRGEDHRRRPRQ